MPDLWAVAYALLSHNEVTRLVLSLAMEGSRVLGLVRSSAVDLLSVGVN